jgi:hypothetical protein
LSNANTALFHHHEPLGSRWQSSGGWSGPSGP